MAAPQTPRRRRALTGLDPDNLTPTRRAPRARNEPIDEPLDMKFMFGTLFNDQLLLLNFLQQLGVIARTFNCPVHNIPCAFVPQTCIDGYVWRCRVCKKEKSVRVNSFFSKSHLEIWQILTIAYLWFSPQTSNSSQFYFIYFVFHSTKLVINSIYSRDQRSSNTDGREKQQELENYVGLVQLLSRCVSRVSSFASRRHDWRSRQGGRD